MSKKEFIKAVLTAAAYATAAAGAIALTFEIIKNVIFSILNM